MQGYDSQDGGLEYWRGSRFRRISCCNKQLSKCVVENTLLNTSSDIQAIIRIYSSCWEVTHVVQICLRSCGEHRLQLTKDYIRWDEYDINTCNCIESKNIVLTSIIEFFFLKQKISWNAQNCHRWKYSHMDRHRSTYHKYIHKSSYRYKSRIYIP